MSLIKKNPMVITFYAVIIVLTCILNLNGRGSEQLLVENDYSSESVIVSNHTIEKQI